MKEVQVFEQWINNMAEGTWALPDTPEQEAKLQELMNQELIAGPDGTNATEQLYDLVGDDHLFDLIQAAAAADPNTNIWDNAEIVERLGELGVDVSAITQRGAEQPQQPVEQPISEGMGDADYILQQLIAGEIDPYQIMNHPQGPEEEYVAKLLQDEYETVAIDHRLHPDDDFEQILDRAVDNLAKNYGHQMDEADTVHSFGECGTVAGSVAPMSGELEEDGLDAFTLGGQGAMAGQVIAGAPGAVIGGALGALAGKDMKHDTKVKEAQWGQAKQDPMNYNGAITGSYYEDENDVDEGWKGTLAGSALGSIAGDAAGSVIGPLAGGALGGAVGGLPGAIAGTAAGAVAGGPVGGAIGGLAGGKIGDKLGGQEETKEAKTGDIVKGAVKAATQGIGDIFGGSKPKDLLTPVSEDPLARIKTLALKQ